MYTSHSSASHLLNIPSGVMNEYWVLSLVMGKKMHSWEMMSQGSWPQGAYQMRVRPWKENMWHSRNFLCWAKQYYTLLSSSNSILVPAYNSSWLGIDFEVILLHCLYMSWECKKEPLYSDFLGWTWALKIRLPQTIAIPLLLYGSPLDPRSFSVWDKYHDSSNLFWSDIPWLRWRGMCAFCCYDKHFD